MLLTSWYLRLEKLPPETLLRIWMMFRSAKTIGRPNDWLALVYVKVPA